MSQNGEWASGGGCEYPKNGAPRACGECSVTTPPRPWGGIGEGIPFHHFGSHPFGF